MTLTRRLGPHAMRTESGPSSLTHPIAPSDRSAARSPSAAPLPNAARDPSSVRETLEPTRMIGAALLAGWIGWSLLALWLLVRPRSWPADSTADLGGLLMWLIAGVLPLASIGRRRFLRVTIVALPVTAFLLLGHVGPILAVFTIALSGPAVAVALLLGRKVVKSEIESPGTSRRPAALPIPAQLPNIAVPQDSSSTLDAAGPSVPSDEEIAAGSDAEDLEESDEESIDEENIDDQEAERESLQRWTRYREAGAERIIGSAIVDLAPGEQTAWLHFPCWPPLPTVPRLTLSSDDPSVSLKGAQRERHGFRIEVRLPRPATFERRLTVEFVAEAEECA